MVQYLIRRLLLGVATIVVVTVLLFLIMQSMPGDPVRMIADPRLPEAQILKLQARWGLDKPLYIQYFVWLGHILSGDMGTSISTRQPVNFLVMSRLPYTLALAGLALLIRYVLGVAVGLFVAVRRGSWADRLLVVGTTVMRSIPSFWLGVLLIILLAVKWPILPISGYSGPASIVLPVLSLALPTIADTMRLTRSEVLEVMREQYVLTARAKGLPGQVLLVKHILRNALIPVTVTFFLSLPWLIGGSVVVESVFSWPGMGRLLWKAIVAQDLPIVQGVVFIIAVLTVLSNTIGDIACAWLDPRIREEYAGGR